MATTQNYGMLRMETRPERLTFTLADGAACRVRLAPPAEALLRAWAEELRDLAAHLEDHADDLRLEQARRDARNAREWQQETRHREEVYYAGR